MVEAGCGEGDHQEINIAKLRCTGGVFVVTMDILKPLAAMASAAIPKEDGDYLQDGLLYCGLCKTPKETMVSVPWGRTFKARCLCACGLRARESEREAQRKQEEADRLERMRSVGVQNQVLRHASFETDDGKNPGPMRMARRYVENWATMRSSNSGLLFYGGCGTGKSYAAACIVNYLIDEGVSAIMLNVAEVLDKAGNFDTGSDWVRDIMRYELLVLDDLGAERNSEFATETMFKFVDSRVRAQKPMICTTNLTLAELREPSDLAHARIYDRVLAMCVPVGFGSDSRRKGEAKDRFDAVRAILNG
jgi:DNA replication protein DnaC